MKSKTAILILALPLLLRAPAAQSQSDSGKATPVIQEKIEWTWSDRSDPIDPHLPNVLLVGDSITRAYFPEVAKQLTGKANVYLFATSCGSGDLRLPGQLRTYLKYVPAFSVIHFNNGLHGWGYDEKTYADALPGMVKTLRQERPSSRLIWATTTPLRRANSGGSNERIDVRNAAALQLMHREGIPIDDQHELMLAHGDLHLDDTHFNDAGTVIQGDQAARSIEAILSAASAKSKS
jgi:lysophospholipase L1-like esterase